METQNRVWRQNASVQHAVADWLEKDGGEHTPKMLAEATGMCRMAVKRALAALHGKRIVKKRRAGRSSRTVVYRSTGAKVVIERPFPPVQDVIPAPADTDKLRRDYADSSRSLSEIAESYGVSRSTLRRWANELGIERKGALSSKCPKGWNPTPEQIAEETRKIRASWSDAEYRARAGLRDGIEALSYKLNQRDFSVRKVAS